MLRTSLLVCLLLSATAAAASDVRIAVAANFSAPMQALAKRFERETSSQLSLSFGSSGKFYAQITQGAPFDIFLSADQAKPARLEEDGWVVTGTRMTYAIGALALWSSDPELIDGTPAVLRKGQFKRLALANPRFAPYGSAAVAVLNSLHLTATLRSHWVTGENISQTFQFVHSGNAELGFVARSQLNGMYAGSGSVWQVPQSLHPPIRQDAVLLERARQNKTAQNMLKFLASPAAHAVIQSFGYLTQADQVQ